MIGVAENGHVIIQNDFYATSTEEEDSMLKVKSLTFKYLRSLIISLLFENDAVEESEESIIINQQFDSFLQYLEEANPM